ncbi:MULTISPECIES: PfkB family carbohydrate kinase [Streptomyces]|uniref:PfkB family carbohydrate kinase n=1 Tax=Streptomyces TaxID=1883 RepID=UPI000A39B090|nr:MULTISPECIES: PfkB family carbohydrate kinase [Streptomyces]QTI90090.1 sugar kinase [Streptomyces sp. AgN23]WTA86096.1 PfkB family carbohydrate kinase [Streptomyces antimycoticus]
MSGHDGTLGASGEVMDGRLVLLGNAIVDLVMRVPALPERGGDIVSTGTTLTTGGGFNVLTAARRLGLPAVYAGAHGTGPFGDRVRADLAREGIEMVLAPVAEEDTGFCVAFVDGGGERTFATSLGAEARLTEAHATSVLAALRPGDLVQISGYGLAYPVNGPVLASLVARLPEHIRVFLDPGPLADQIPEEVLAPVLERCDWVSCNQREGRLLTGRDDAQEAAAALAARLGPRTGVLLRADAAGCWLVPPGGEPLHIPGRRVTAVDSNGAGDAHTGAFLALLGHGLDPGTTVRGANAAAAFAVTRHGPATGPTLGELVDFLDGDPLAARLSSALGR